MHLPKRYDLTESHIHIVPGSLHQGVQVDNKKIASTYTFSETRVNIDEASGKVSVWPESTILHFEVDRTVPRVGVMLVGWGGNNGSTLTASLLAHRKNVSWRTRRGLCSPNYYGSLILSGTMMLGKDSLDNHVFAPFTKLLPFVDPVDLVIGGWDISHHNLKEACYRSQVLEPDLLRPLESDLELLSPLPSYYDPKYIALNQADRADNIIASTDISFVLETIRADIKKFKTSNNVDSVIILWTANTERYSSIIPGVNDTADNFLAAIKQNHAEISPSSLFATASLLEGCPFINGSPQNTFVPGLIELAQRLDIPIAGDDFKSGQTKLKSVLVDFLVGAGIKPLAITSYNHLGNNDGKNLAEELQFKSKEISKSNIVDDMVYSNSVLYKDKEHPDHTIVIKYVPSVGDSKRALDEYENEIFMHGRNTIAIHNTCEDSLLAVPLMLDLILLTEFFCRIRVKTEESTFEKLSPILSLLAYMLKAPLFPEGALVVNSLPKQRLALENFFRALLGLPPQTELHWNALLK